MSFWNKILIFLGFKKRRPVGFKDMLAQLSSQDRQDESRIKAYQAIQSGDDIKPNQNHPYESTLRTDSIMVDTECTKYHVNIIKGYFSDLQHLSVLLKSSLQSELARTSPSDIEGKIKSSIAQHQAEADRIVREYETTKQDLEIFKGANGIKVSAIYPDRKNAFYWLAFFGIVEALFNAFFLRQGISFLNSLFVAFGIAALNVILNAFLGIKYRIKNHIRREEAKRGKFYSILSAITILLINGAIAFYRFRYISANEGFNDAFWLESTVLFLIGISMGVAAFFKGYQSDDPYPGYGHYARKFDKCSKRLDEVRRAHAVYCTELKQQADSDLDDLGIRILTTYDAFNANLPEIARELKTWEEDRRQVDFAYRQLQEIFKITISANHPRGSEGYPKNIQNLSENIELESYEAQLNDFTKNRKDIAKQVDLLQKSTLSRKQSLQKWWQSIETATLLKFPQMPDEKNSDTVKKKLKKSVESNADTLNPLG
jgi:hypothetical protein